MLRTTISKLRQVCALTFIPRLLRGDIRYAPDRFEKLSVCVQRRDDKSTCSSKQDQEDYERCQQIIDRAFSPPDTDIVDMDAKYKETFVNMVTPQVPPESQCEKCQRIINQIFGEETAGDRKKDIVDPISIPLTELQATTAKDNPETLAQKVERIDEMPLVEAPPRPKIEGFNVHSKVLGKRKQRRIGQRISMLTYSTEKSAQGRRKGTFRKDGNFDELAKRCLDSPSSHIDERLLKEMEKLGVPPTSRRGSRRTTNDSGILQPEIMRRPRRPVAKTELDFLTMRRANFLRLYSDLPPPFELTPSKARSINRVACTDTDDSVLRYERIPPQKDQVLTDVVAMSEDAESESLKPVISREVLSYPEERPPQQLLGQMTAAVISESGDQVEELANRQEKHNHRQEETVSFDYGEEHDGVIKSFSKTKELENEDSKDVVREKLASTRILSELVDPKEISPQTHSPGIIREEFDVLMSLLRTRDEYLTQERIKRLYPKDDPYLETGPEDHTVVMEEFNESEVGDTLQQLGIDNSKIENVKMHHLKDLNISQEVPSFPEPSVVIRECTDARPRAAPEQSMLKNDSQGHEKDTTDKHFERLSTISGETESGVKKDDTSKINKEMKAEPWNSGIAPTPDQFINNVGIVPKGPSPPEHPSVTSPQITLAEKFDPNRPLIDPYDKRCHKYEEDEDESFQASSKTAIRKEQTVQTSREIPLIEEEPEEPVIGVETDRLPKVHDQNMLQYKLHSTPHQPILPKAPNKTDVAQEAMIKPLLSKETKAEELKDDDNQVLEHKLNSTHQQSELAEAPNSADAAREAMLNPLLGRGTIAHVGPQNANMPPANIPSALPTDIGSVNEPKKRIADQSMPLSEMLKRVRERNRLQLCKEFEVRMVGPAVEPLVGSCGKKQPPCPPPAPTCPPPPPKPCPPTKPPCPNPCKPKCPPTCPPNPCAPKPQCPPPKKSPCEKFKKCTKCSNIKIQDALTLLLYLGPQFHVPQKSLLPLLACTCHFSSPSKTDFDMDRALRSLHNLCSLVLVASMRNEVGVLGSALVGEGKVYAKTYDPWTPIPSWPIPVKEEKRKLVCPKDGCKVIPPKCNPPCRELYPCRNFPKKHFSIIDLFTVLFGQQKVVYDIGDF